MGEGDELERLRSELAAAALTAADLAIHAGALLEELRDARRQIHRLSESRMELLAALALQGRDPLSAPPRGDA